VRFFRAPLDVIIGAIVIPTQAVIPVQNGKKFLFLILEKEGSHGRNCNKNRCFPINFIWIESRRYGHHKWCNGFENETPVKVIIK
jgi:hypothetical protein